MNKTIWRTISILILTSLVLVLAGCVDTLENPSELASNPGNNTSADPGYVFSQATIDAGQRQLLDLSIKATEIQMNMDQAQDAAALSTLDAAQKQKLELDFQATLVSENITKAAAMQELIVQQTAVALQATAEAQSQAATITQLAFQAMVTQTAQAQATNDARVQQTAEAVVALTAYPLTATPLAVTQAALLMQQYDREQQTFLDKVVAPLLPIFAVGILAVFIALLVFANRRVSGSRPWLPRLRAGRQNDHLKPPRIIDGVAVIPDRLENESIQPEQSIPGVSHLPDENPAHIEIVNAAEIPIAHWIHEVENRLAAERGLTL